MSTLEELNLSCNTKLSSFRGKSFNGLKFLTILDLSYMSLSSLASDVFDGLTSLKKLYLEGPLLISVRFTLPETTEILNGQLTNIVDVDENVFSKESISQNKAPSAILKEIIIPSLLSKHCKIFALCLKLSWLQKRFEEIFLVKWMTRMLSIGLLKNKYKILVTLVIKTDYYGFRLCVLKYKIL